MKTRSEMTVLISENKIRNNCNKLHNSRINVSKKDNTGEEEWEGIFTEIKYF